MKDILNAKCQSGLRESPWVDLEFPESEYHGHVCGGGTDYPKYASYFNIENRNYRTIATVENCDGFGLSRYRPVSCPAGTTRINSQCVIKAGAVSKNKSLGKMSCEAGNPAAGNPINVVFGNKVQVETDLDPSPLSGLGITRIYNSRDIHRGISYRFGIGWHSSHDRSIRLSVKPGYEVVKTAYLTRPDARTWYFTLVDGIWQTDADVPGTLVRTAEGWLYENERDEIEIYNAAGRLIRITTRKGIVFDYTYNMQNDVAAVSTNLGESLSFDYDADRRITAITDHSGRIWKYSYDGSNNLEFVTYPDGTPEDDSDNPVRQYHYEDSDYPHALTGITDERGKRYASFEYGVNTRPTASYHGPQTSVLTDRLDGVSIVYDGNVRTVTNSNGEASNYTRIVHNGVPMVADITGPGCASCGSGNSSYQYDPQTRDLLEKTENGITIRYGDYDANGNPGYRIEAPGTPEERRTDYTYYPGYFSKIATITGPSVHPGSSKVTSYSYDGFGNRTAETVSGFTPDGTPVSRTTTWQYDGPLHQLSRIDGPRSDVSDITTFRYYPDDPLEGYNRARLMEIEDATGTLIRSNIRYTATGMVASDTRPNGLTTAYTYYPGNDRLKTLTESDGVTSRVTRWTYLPTGEVESITAADATPDATILTFGYDDARRLIRITDGLGNAIEYTLDTEGNRVAVKTYDDAGMLRKALTRTFDTFNRLDIASQANETVDYDYAPDGTLDRQTDGRGYVTDYDYDSLQRLLGSIRDPGGLGAVTRYGYDAADNLTSVTDPVSGDTAYVYDDLGNLISTTSPDTGITIFTYDEAGNLKSRHDAGGQLFLYSYDALNRLTAIDAPGTEDDILYGYDTCPNGSGRLCSVIPPASILTYAYDAFGNITQHQGIVYTHDASNRVRTMTYPSGAIVSYAYDAAGQVNRVDLAADGVTTTLAGSISYAPFGRVQDLTYGSGATLTQTEDSASRLMAQVVPGILDLGYTDYDTNGNLESRADAYSSPASFGYDALDRLAVADGDFGSRAYDYDLNGNRTGLVSGTAAIAYGYTPGSNRLASEDGWSYTLDANGNTTARLDSEGTGRFYTYNSHNRLISATKRSVTPGRGKKSPTITDTVLGDYSYNGLGQRVGKVVAGGVATRFLYGTDGALLAELDGSGYVQREYVYLNRELLAVIDQEAASAGGAEIIVDNDIAPAGWASVTSNKDYGADHLYSAGGSGNAVRWTPVLAAGQYEVHARWISDRSYSGTVPYTIVHEGQANTVAVDQTHNSGKWQLLGMYNFGGTGDEYVEVSDSSGRTTADAVKFVNVGGGAVNAAVVSYVHNDHLGTPQAMSDETGKVTWRANYDPFGAAAVDEDPDGDRISTSLNIRFPGQYYDQETGLHYNYFRYYDPSTGRYINSDPVGLGGGLNTYAYVGNNPLKYLDFYGLDSQMCYRPFYPIPQLYARHCFLEFSDGSSSSFDPDGTHEDPAPDWWPKSCQDTEGEQDDDCLKRAMMKCKADQYDFTGFNCCHCVEQAMRECGLNVPRDGWPNWPVNPGPQPGEPGYHPIQQYGVL
ncbi:MAG: RHS repeat-associated core domain-containing protein [Gammaproteobacteria bacterium]